MKSVLIGTVLFLSQLAFANDAGVPYINVNDLTLREADVGSKIEFKGPDAINLYNALPPMDAENHRRGFTALGKQKAVSIICYNSEYIEKTSSYKKLKDGPECIIAVVKAFATDSQDGNDYIHWTESRGPQSIDKKKNPGAVKKTEKK